MSKQLTAGELLSYLEKYSPDSEITFGSTKYTARPLIFYRFKLRGDNLMQIELNELDENIEPTTSEHECRETVGYFVKSLKEIPSEMTIEFGSSLDAVPLEFGSVTGAVAINLEQKQEPLFKVRN